MTSESPAILSDGLIRAAAAAAPVTVSSRTDDIPASWDERTVLVTMLDYVRDTGVRPRRPQVRPWAASDPGIRASPAADREAAT